MPKNVESPAQEMQRLVRTIAGKRQPGEKDPSMMARAARRLRITQRRARTYWYAESQFISSTDMDLARELAFVQPLQEAHDAIEIAERYLEGLRLRLADRRRAGGPSHHQRRSTDRDANRNSYPTDLARGLTSSRRSPTVA